MKKIDAFKYPLLLSMIVFVVCGLRYEFNSAATNAVVAPIAGGFLLLMTLGNLFVFNLPRELTYRKLLGKTIVLTNSKVINIILTAFVVTLGAALTGSGILSMSLLLIIYLMSLMRIRLLGNGSTTPESGA